MCDVVVKMVEEGDGVPSEMSSIVSYGHEVHRSYRRRVVRYCVDCYAQVSAVDTVSCGACGGSNIKTISLPASSRGSLVHDDCSCLK